MPHFQNQSRLLADSSRRQNSPPDHPRWKGNVWVTSRFGTSSRGKATLGRMVDALRSGGEYVEVMAPAMQKQRGGPEGGSVTLLRPDGSQYPGPPFTGGGLPGPWAATVDGNDNVWISNFSTPNSQITELCGVRTETCPPGFKTGDQISPPGGYVGGGLQTVSYTHLTLPTILLV